MLKPKITIVVPIYGDWPSLKDCIYSLDKYTGSAVGKILLVNDCGPEADFIEKNIKKSIRGKAKFKYFRNPQNLGFVKNCNNAVYNLDKTTNDILLLNSDTEVTGGFLEELQSVLYGKERIVSVSPRSNNATIFTVPIESIVDKKTVSKKKSFSMFVVLHTKLPSYTEVPTTHGFCMLIKRKIIEKYGLFDEVFGKGYGEEVDFCQRVIQKGYICAMSNHSYVYHLEAKSFTHEVKNKLIQSSEKIITKRYPNYNKEVYEYIKNAVALENKLIGQRQERISQLVSMPKKLVNKTLRYIKSIVM